MFDELLTRVGPRITKQNTTCREALDPGLTLALTLWHLASGTKYQSMSYGGGVPHNTISLLVPKVCQAIIDECLDEVMRCPTTAEEWRAISDKFARGGTLSIHVVHLMASTSTTRVLQTVVPYTIYTIICLKSVCRRSQTAGRNSCSIVSGNVSLNDRIV